MKEQRSLSVGSLPGNIKSHILKTIQYDHLAKPYRDLRQGSDVFAEGLNKINELTEEYEKVPAATPESPFANQDNQNEPAAEARDAESESEAGDKST